MSANLEELEGVLHHLRDRTLADSELDSLMQQHRDTRDIDLDDPRWDGKWMQMAFAFWTFQDLKAASAFADEHEEGSLSVAITEQAPKLIHWLASLENPRAPLELRASFLELFKTDKRYRAPLGHAKVCRNFLRAHLDELPEEAKEGLHHFLMSECLLMLEPE